MSGPGPTGPNENGRPAPLRATKSCCRVATMSDRVRVLQEFGRAFWDFRRSAFRLETLPQYLVDSEKEPFAEFLAGRPLPPPEAENAEWRDIVATNVAAGKTMQRIHVLPQR